MGNLDEAMQCYETFEETTQHLPYPVDTNRDFYAREWGQYIVESKSSTF